MGDEMGPLTGLRVIELAGIGPGPFCAMMLADMGAEVIRIDRKGASGGSKFDVMNRNRRSIALDLKKPQAIETVLRLVEKADALQEGFRPGVTERLGLGPDICLARNKKLVYGRMTGWGQDGPLAQAAGHDLNYIALSGALSAIGPTNGKPVPPLNLVGDFGGGAMYLAFGMVCALLEAQRSGQGQVVDAAMVDGAASLMAMFFSFTASGIWKDQRGSNLLDGGAHFYDTYECADGLYVAIGSIEPQFYALLREKAGLTDPAFDAQMDRDAWPDLKAKLAAVIKTKSRAQWTAIMEGTDVCFAPVLSIAEVKDHPHNAARGTIINVAGVDQPAPAPRFSRTKAAVPTPPSRAGSDTKSVLADWGFSAAEIETLESQQAI
jgi:alpha-methylacyl-CoA racemase